MVNSTVELAIYDAEIEKVVNDNRLKWAGTNFLWFYEKL